MTYDSEKIAVGRKPIRLCAMYLPFCVKDYGQSSTNKISYSEDYPGFWSKTSITVTSGDITDFAPNGQFAAYTLTDSNSGAISSIYATPTSFDTTKIYVGYTFIKKYSHTAGNLPGIEIYYGASTVQRIWAAIDTNTGDYALTSSGSPTNTGAGVIDYGDYNLFWVSGKTTDASNLTLNFHIYPAFVSSLSDLTQKTDRQGSAVFWAGQLNEGSAPTFYVSSSTVGGTTGQCTASGGSGSECYNTYNTCQDKANFVPIEKRYLFSELTTERDIDGAIPCIQNIDTAHASIEVGKKSTGKRGGFAVEFVDFPHHDRGVDPYVSTRSSVQGNYFSKLKERHRFFNRHRVKLITGYLASGYDPANFKERMYFMERLEGPRRGGAVKMVAHDALKLISSNKKVVPEVTSGTLTATLAAATTTNFTVSGDTTKYPTGGGSVRINSEIISYSSGVDNMDGTYTFSTLTRGEDNTTAAQHASGDTVQKCVKFTSQTADQIALALYTTYGGIDSVYIDTAQWAIVANIWLKKTYTRRITKPTGIDELLAQIHQQMGFFTWYDEEDSKIKLEAVRPPDYNTITTYKESETIKGDSLDVKENPEDRLTDLIVFYNSYDSINLDNDEDYQNWIEVIDGGAESSNEYGDSIHEKIHAAWLTATSAATTIAGRNVARRRNPPKRFIFEADAKNESLKVGDQFYMDFDLGTIQDKDGNAKTVLLQVLQRDEIKTGTTYGYRCWELFYEGRYAFISPASTPDYSSATEAQKNAYGFISAAGGTDFSDGGTAYKIV